MTKSGFHRRKSKTVYDEIELIPHHDPKEDAVPTDSDSLYLDGLHSPLNQGSDNHVEPHFESSEIIRDVVIGLSDGLTVPFALAAGLAALDNSRLVVTAGMAEIAAGAISMGMGGYLAGHLEIEHYDAERARELYEVETVPEREEEEIVEIFEPFGLSKKDLIPLLTALKQDPEKWVDFMMVLISYIYSIEI